MRVSEVKMARINYDNKVFEITDLTSMFHFMRDYSFEYYMEYDFATMEIVVDIKESWGCQRFIFGLNGDFKMYFSISEATIDEDSEDDELDELEFIEEDDFE